MLGTLITPNSIYVKWREATSEADEGLVISAAGDAQLPGRGVGADRRRAP